MSLDDIANFGLMIFPGGAGGTEVSSLTSTTHATLRSAVQDVGVSYPGFCAGVFIAVAPKPLASSDVSCGLGIVDGLVMDYYYLENLETGLAMTLESFPDGSVNDLL